MTTLRQTQGTTKEEAERSSATLAQQWRDNVQYLGVDLVDVFQYELRRQFGAIWKQWLDESQAKSDEQAAKSNEQS